MISLLLVVFFAAVFSSSLNRLGYFLRNAVFRVKPLKIINYSLPTPEGVSIEFNRPIRLNGHLPAKDWFVSWDKLSELVQRGLDE